VKANHLNTPSSRLFTPPQGGVTSALRAIFLLSLLVSTAFAQFFPLADRDTVAADGETTETWVLYPFFQTRETTSTLVTGLAPLFSKIQKKTNSDRDTYILYPFILSRRREQTLNSTDYRRLYVVPLFFTRTEKQRNRKLYNTILIPFWYEGKQEKRGAYKILFPFFWYAENAKLAVPLFPPREQTFAALWPIIGDFRGYWNRDRIFFFLWPIYVHSSKGDGLDRNSTTSLIWPILGLHHGPRVHGLRIFPLFSYATKKDAEGEKGFHRSYWLWPLGHRRTGRISDSNAGKQDVTFFFPFYGKFRQPNIKLDFILPFYGKLHVGQRVSRGYFFALYNNEFNYRNGYREDRFLLFIFRKRQPLKGYEQTFGDKDPRTGSAFLPFYSRFKNKTSTRQVILWPFFTYRYNQYTDYEHIRKFFVPFFVSLTKKYSDGRVRNDRFIFPFYRQRTSVDGERRTNYIHAFYYMSSDAIEYSYSPLWTWQETQQNLRTGEKTIRWFKNAVRWERRADGSLRQAINLFLISHKRERAASGELESWDSRVLGGLVGREKREDGSFRTRLLWIPF